MCFKRKQEKKRKVEQETEQKLLTEMVEAAEYNDPLIFGSEEEYKENVSIYKDFSMMCDV